MSIKAETKKKIMLYMMEHIDNDDTDIVSKTVSTFKISRTSAYRYLAAMKEEGVIEANEGRWCGYSLHEQTDVFYYQNKGLNEDSIYYRDIKPLVADRPKNVCDIIAYIFMEMMNNAIEHSDAERIMAIVKTNRLNTKIIIADNGVGIFNRIQAYFKNMGEDVTLDEAVNALLPGKLTTAEKDHSGEGIFFSSRAADRFNILSGDRLYKKDVFAPEMYEFTKVSENISKAHGTIVAFSIANNSPKVLKDVFDMYSDPDKGFFKTQIPIAHIFPSGYPMSRSEGRRLASFLTKFEEVTLDFRDVENIGQAFTHELFIVFQRNHPDIRISVENANEDVQRMISRVRNTK